MDNMDQPGSSSQEDDTFQITDLEPEQSPRKRSPRLGSIVVQNVFLNPWIRNGLFSLLSLFLLSVLFWQFAPWQQNRQTGLAPIPDPPSICFRDPPNGAVMNHQLFVQDLTGTLGAYQLETGHLLWSTKLAGVATLQANTQAIYVYFRFKPGTGRLEALRATDGQVLWQRDLPLTSIVANIQLNNNILYTNGTAGAIYAVQASTGHLNWSYTPDNPSSPVNNLLYIQNGILEAQVGKDTIVFLNAQTGRAIMDIAHATNAQLLIEGPLLYVLPYSNTPTGNTNLEVFQLDQGGKLLWRRPLLPKEIPILEQDNVIYLGRDDGSQLNALNGSTGQILWMYNPPAGDAMNNFVVTRGLFLFLTFHQTLIGLNVHNGQVIWQTSIPDLAPDQTSPVQLYTQQNLLFLARAQQPGEQSSWTIAALRVSDGHLLWKITPSGNMNLLNDTFLTIQENGRIDAWNSNNGQHLWSYQGNAQSYIYDTPASNRPLLLLSSEQCGVVVLQLGNGRQLWGILSTYS
jgi:outer membrane protein assembly factor BamB